MRCTGVELYLPLSFCKRKSRTFLDATVIPFACNIFSRSGNSLTPGLVHLELRFLVLQAARQTIFSLRSHKTEILYLQICFRFLVDNSVHLVCVRFFHLDTPDLRQQPCLLCEWLKIILTASFYGIWLRE